MSQDKIYRSIAAAKNEKGLVEFVNKLRVADISHFSRLLAEDSRIGIVVQDYSKGTGEHNVIVEANIFPEEAQELFERAKAIFYFGCKGDFQKNWMKIFGEHVDENGNKDGYSIVHKLTITRKAKDPKGEPMRYPWTIEIENGKGKMREDKNALVSGSYVREKGARKMVSDEEFILMIRRVDSCIREFERRAADKLFEPAYQMMESERLSKQFK